MKNNEDMKCNSQKTFKKNGQMITAPCGKCYPCYQNKRNDWTFRLSKEMKFATSAWFLTLTYNDENLPIKNIDGGEVKKASVIMQELDLDVLKDEYVVFTEYGKSSVMKYVPTLVKADYQKFMKRLRKASDKWWDELGGMDTYLERKPIKYFSVGEYGSKTRRPHYHAIIFNVPKAIIESLDKIWKDGFVKAGTVTPASIHYVTKYCLKEQTPDYRVLKPFSTVSNGIGEGYILTNGKWHRDNELDYVHGQNGSKQRIPRYVRNRVLTKKIADESNTSKMLLGDKAEMERITRCLENGEDPGEHMNEIVRQQNDKLNKLRNNGNI